MTRPQWSEARRAVLAQKGVTLLDASELRPAVRLKLDDRDAFERVRRLPIVDYVEPVYLKQVEEGWASGCSAGDQWGYTGNIGGDLVDLEGFRQMGIQVAWERSQGAGVTVGLIDTGVSENQPELRMSGGFTSGQSYGRSLTEAASSYGTAQCSHGTRMAGLIAAPRNGREAVGIAYRSSLYSYRHANNVYGMDGWDTARAIDSEAGNGSKVIAMAFQVQFGSDYVRDAIRQWYYGNDQLFIGAAGTSGWDPIPNSNVLFPAEMAEVFAVTGTYHWGEGPCDNCHYGSKVALAAIIGQVTQGMTPGSVTDINGSSSAVAVISGVAALVYARYPNANRAFVVQRLESSGNKFGNRSNEIGAGIVNAWKAVGVMSGASAFADVISGGGFNEVTTYQLTAYGRTAFPEGYDGPYTYRWDGGQTTQSIQATIGPGDPQQQYGVTVTDVADGRQIHTTVVISPPPGGCANPRQIICD